MNEFRNISKVGFMKHNGGLEFRQLTEKEYEFKTEIQDYHINAGGVTHGGFIMSMLDSGMGTAAHQVIEGSAVTISLNTNFIGGSKAGDKIIGLAKIKKKTRSLIFMYGQLKCEDKLLASAEGIWKII
ncbi:MAG: thioesterase [Pelagibacteraceae bacterium]|nr:thioesterase [Pelagibacteraceae bacterium]|tara:strand:+ start:2978 stop:3361 length:384 start_codon:yes stop_codon:yes gene_type:complete